jgi:hypothetical protein
MSNLKYARNGAAAAVVAALLAWGYQAVGAPEKQIEQAWSFDMWCLEMQLYPAKRCDARTPEDQQEYQQYRADVENYRQEQQGKAKRDQELLLKFDRNLPGPPGPTNR